MARTNLQTLRERAKRVSDQERSEFIEDSEWNEYINDGYAKLYSTYLQLNEDYFTVRSDFLLVEDQEYYALPSDFFKLKRVDYLPAGDESTPISVYPFQNEEGNRFKYYHIFSTNIFQSSYRYRLTGPLEIRLLPTPAGVGNSDTIRVHYIPDFTRLVNDTDEVKTEQVFDEYITLYAAVKAYVKEESVPKDLMTLFKEVEEQVYKTASTRNEAQPKGIAVISDDYQGLYRYRNGFYDGENQ